MTAYEDQLTRPDRAFLVARDLLGVEHGAAVFILATERAKERAASMLDASTRLAPDAVDEREAARAATRLLDVVTDRMTRDYEQAWEIGADAEQTLADHVDEYAEAAQAWHTAMGDLIVATTAALGVRA